MSENTVTPVTKKGRGRFWLIFGAGIILMIVYQWGHSAGKREGMDPLAVISTSQAPVSTPIPLNQRYRRIPSESEFVVQHSAQPIPTVIETDSGIVPSSYTGILPAPGESVYDHQPGSGQRLPAGTKPSEVGLMPLLPLEPLQPVSSAVHSAVIPSTYRQPVPIPASRTTFKEPALAPPVPIAKPASAPGERPLSPVRITSSSACDCGKEH